MKGAMEIQVNSEAELNAFGVRMGTMLSGGEAIELIGDVGAGKTTLTKAVAAGMGIDGTISSPSYTLSQTYEAPSGLRLVHYDFYRLDDAGILAQDLEEMLSDLSTVVIVEWGGIVENVLPEDCVRITITPVSETARRIHLAAGGEKSQTLLEKIV